MLKWETWRCKIELKQITKSRENMLQKNENWILRNMGLKFQNLGFNAMQNSILEQAKVDHKIRQIWFSKRKKK